MPHMCCVVVWVLCSGEFSLGFFQGFGLEENGFGCILSLASFVLCLTAIVDWFLCLVALDFPSR